MIKMMFVENEAEAAKVEAMFAEIKKAIEEKGTFEKSPCFDECAFLDGRGQAFAVYVDPSKEIDLSFRIPYGSLVYVYRHVGGGYAVYDVYSFGYHDKFAVERDVEGDLAGLANLSEDFFPNI